MYLYAKKRTENLRNRRVNLETRVQLDEGGQLTISMHTWAVGLRGAHANHTVLLVDDKANELWMMPTVLLGVAGKGEFWNRKGQDRSTTFKARLPEAVHRRAKAVVIHHDEEGGQSFWDWLAANWPQLGSFLIALIDIAAKTAEPMGPTPEGSFAPQFAKQLRGGARSARAMTPAEYATYEKRVLSGEEPDAVRESMGLGGALAHG